MNRLLFPGGSLQRGNSCRSALGVLSVLGALVASCATGTDIDEDVRVVRPSPGVESGGDPAAAEAPASAAEPSTNEVEVAADAELTPASGEMSEGTPNVELPPADQAEEEAPSSSPPADEEPRGDPEQLPEDLPIAEPDEPDLGPDPSTQPAPTPDLSPEDDGPTDPPGAAGVAVDPLPTLDPELPILDPELPNPVLPALTHCLSAWEGSSCDVCSGQTQSDLLACRVHIDCYIVNECDPLSCGSLDQVCGVNRLGNGLAPKDIADAVYGCMCAP